MKIFLAFCLAVLTLACASLKPPDKSKEPGNCHALYVLAPENYIIELAADSSVVLDPAWHPFILYCSPQEAANARDGLAASGRMQKDKWRIYSLDGTFAELVRIENGRRMLACPARLSGWVGEESK